MRRYLDAIMSADVPPDDTSRCTASRNTLRTLRHWRRQPSFPPWLEREIERRLADDVSVVWLVVDRLARRGDLSACKLYLARFDTHGDRLDPITPQEFYKLALLAETQGTSVPPPPEKTHET